MKNLINPMTTVTRFDAVMSFAGPTSEAVHLL